jgi:hypothetical protein
MSGMSVSRKRKLFLTIVQPPRELYSLSNLLSPPSSSPTLPAETQQSSFELLLTWVCFTGAKAIVFAVATNWLRFPPINSHKNSYLYDVNAVVSKPELSGLVGEIQALLEPVS